MAEFKIRKSQALPTTLEPNTIYLIKSASDNEVTVHISDNNATTPSAKGLTYLNKKGGTMTGPLGLAGVSTNAFVAGPEDNNTFAEYNFGLSGWNSMAFLNASTGGAFPTQVSGLVDFRNGIINMKGGFQVNTGGRFGNGFSDTASHYFRPIVDGSIYNVSTAKSHLFRVNNATVSAINATGIASLNPRGGTLLGNFWKLGNASPPLEAPLVNDTAITVSVNGVLYSLLAKKITEEEEAY